MLVKAYIVSRSTIAGEENKYVVRIPILHGVEGTPQFTPDNLLPTAAVCGLPGFTNIARPGDVVYVAFENNDYNVPVIMGQLLSNLDTPTVNESNITNTRPDAVLQSLQFFDGHDGVYTSAQLPTKTTIGIVTAEEIAYLSRLKDNIQTQLDGLSERLNKLGG